MRPSHVLALALAAAAPGAARAYYDAADYRKTTPRDLSLEVERLELPNGLVVLLAPDPSASSVLVWTSFRAGALYEPPGRSGLAHLVEHLMASGPTPDTDYDDLLERRRARAYNATTDFDEMRFLSVVPPEELPLALWIAADRLATLPGLLDPARVEQSRRVVLEERALRNVDAPYGLAREQLYSRLFARPHPLHGGVIGTPEELAAVTVDDVRAFVAERLVPANGILTVVGRFDPAVARRLVEEGLGRLPGGRRSAPPRLAPLTGELVEGSEERVSRAPRVTLAWRLQGLGREDAVALRLGAQLLSFLTDGAWGMRLGADLAEYGSEALFEVDLTVPYDEPPRVVQDDVEGFLRRLTHVEMPVELIRAANLALDRFALFELDTLEGRAEALTTVELRYGGKVSLGRWNALHWELERGVVRDTARTWLRAPKVVWHARPTRPKPARKERE